MSGGNSKLISYTIRVYIDIHIENESRWLKRRSNRNMHTLRVPRKTADADFIFFFLVVYKINAQFCHSKIYVNISVFSPCVCVNALKCISAYSDRERARSRFYMQCVWLCFIWCAYTPSCYPTTETASATLYMLLLKLYILCARTAKPFPLDRCNICVYLVDGAWIWYGFEWKFFGYGMRKRFLLCFVHFKSRRLYFHFVSTIDITRIGLCYPSLSIVGCVSVHRFVCI